MPLENSEFFFRIVRMAEDRQPDRRRGDSRVGYFQLQFSHHLTRGDLRFGYALSDSTGPH